MKRDKKIYAGHFDLDYITLGHFMSRDNDINDINVTEIHTYAKIDAGENEYEDGVVDDQKNITIAEIEAHKVSGLGGIDYDTALSDVDSVSQNLVNCFATFYKKNKDGSILEVNSDGFYVPREFIYIDKFVVHKDARGKGFGKRIIEQFVDDLGVVDIYVLPFAIEDNLNKNSHKRVENFWKSVFFERQKRSEFYYLKDFMSLAEQKERRREQEEWQ
jgi:GNAT superfamily N-acetyltransferase